MKLKEVGKVYLDSENQIDLDSLREYLKKDGIDVLESDQNTKGLIGFFGHPIGLVRSNYIFTLGTGGEINMQEEGKELLEKKLDKLMSD